MPVLSDGFPVFQSCHTHTPEYSSSKTGCLTRTRWHPHVQKTTTYLVLAPLAIVDDRSPEVPTHPCVGTSGDRRSSIAGGANDFRCFVLLASWVSDLSAFQRVCCMCMPFSDFRADAAGLPISVCFWRPGHLATATDTAAATNVVIIIKIIIMITMKVEPHIMFAVFSAHV